MSFLRVTLWAVCLVQTLSLSRTSFVSPDGPDPLSNASGPNDVELSQPSERIGMTLDTDERSELTLAVANSIGKLSSFVAQEAAEGNDDLFFTLRMAQGQLYQLRQEVPALYADETLGPLLTAADADLASAADVLEQNFQSSEHLGEEFQALMDPARGRTMVRIDPTSTVPDFEMKWRAAFEENLAKAGDILQFSPRNSDRCLGQLSPLNLTIQETALTGRSSYCPVDAPCWLMMTKPGAQGYYLTHQVMFLALGGTLGCERDFESWARRYFANWLPSDVGPITPEILRRQCLSVLMEANLIVATGIPDIEKDYFLEQGFLCGVSVYMPEFFDPSWIRTVLSWQKPSGCFGFFDNIPYPGEDASWGRSLQAVEELSVVEGSERESVGPSARGEKPMTDDCYSHNTGVALGYLSVALRYLTD